MCLLLGCCAVFGQDSKIEGWQEKSGFALVKPQAWSQENQAKLVEFQAFIDRTVKEGAVAGYFIFRTSKNPKLQVPAALVVRWVVYPEPVSRMICAEERTEIQKKIDDWKTMSAKFPLAARILEKPLAALGEDVAKFDAGNVKDAGKWVPKVAYYKKKADDLVDLAKMEITRTKKVSAVSLSANQYYIGLEEMAKIEPSVTPQMENVRSLYDSLCRKEARIELCDKLKAPDVTFERSVAYVKALKSLRPEEDEAVVRAIGAWDRSVDQAAKLCSRIDAQRAAFEQELSTKTDATHPVVLSEDLASQASKITGEFVGFPPAIQLPLPLAKAMAACATSLPDVQKDMEARQYLEAKLKIVELEKPASLVGPSTSAAVDLLQKKANVEIERFSSRVSDAKALQAAGKPNDALVKYREAWEIIPDKGVAAQIESLKK